MRVLAVVTLAACGGSGPAAPDAAVPDEPGLSIRWSAQPALPGPVKADVTVTAAHFMIAYIQVIGDAGPGDLRTTDFAVQLDWDADGQPAPLAFPGAPAGLYSKVAFHLDGGLITDSYGITGTAKVNGVQRTFTIRDRADVRVSVDHVDATLAPEGALAVPIRLMLDRAIGRIDFGALDHGPGDLILDAASEQLEDFRDELGDAFADHASATSSSNAE